MKEPGQQSATLSDGTSVGPLTNHVLLGQSPNPLIRKTEAVSTHRVNVESKWEAKTAPSHLQNWYDFAAAVIIIIILKIWYLLSWLWSSFCLTACPQLNGSTGRKHKALPPTTAMDIQIKKRHKLCSLWLTSRSNKLLAIHQYLYSGKGLQLKFLSENTKRPIKQDCSELCKQLWWSKPERIEWRTTKSDQPRMLVLFTSVWQSNTEWLGNVFYLPGKLEMKH